MAAKGRLHEPERTTRALRAYLDLIGAADRLREQMRRHLAGWDLTETQFEVMQLLLRDGPLHLGAISRGFARYKQNMTRVVRSLKQEGWVQVGPASTKIQADESKVQADAKSTPHSEGLRDRRILVVHLTPEGERVIRRAIVRYAKIVKAEMRTLEGREQATLSRLCQKLEQGNALEFLREIRMMDSWQEDWGAVTRSAGSGQASG
jgi:DNA-binding MarR family transcriptional regulator